ncbi:hypothetical protein ABEB36_010864 [Hypothenemus hampei]|uniref:Uncharacterized protein n=1 Tax=Hypothenemus hampei TaxID=57062 RepID=A0ABD1EDB1_HYPHA
MCFKVLWVIMSLLGCLQLNRGDEEGYLIKNKVRYPFSKFYDPFMGFLVAVDIKLTPSEIDADFSWNIEANYFLPQNESEFRFPPIIPEESEERGFLERSILYKMIELKLGSASKSFGGSNCLLRIICEMALYTTRDTNIFGDLLHVILSPHSSIDDLPDKYHKAENYGNKKKHCKKYIKKCPIDILSLFSVFGEILDNKFLN